jgi:hypothetical protein
MEGKVYKIDNSKELIDYLIPIVFVFAFFIIIQQILISILFLLLGLFLFSILRRDVFFGEDSIEIKRVYAPYLSIIKVSYSDIDNTSLFGGSYLTRLPTSIRVKFKHYFKIEYKFKDEFEREEFLKLLIKKNVKVNDNNLTGMKELLNKLKKEN